MPDYYSADSASVLTYDIHTEVFTSSIDGDVGFYLGLARRAGGPVLELGAGTGRVTWPLAAAGFEVVGLDLAPAMLAEAEAKRAAQPPDAAARARFVQGDMADFALGRTFPLIVSPARSFNHLTAPGEGRACLAAIRRHLAPGGLAALHLFDPGPALLTATGDRPEAEATEIRLEPHGERVRFHVVHRAVDWLRQRIEQTVEFTVWRPDGGVALQSRERVAFRWFTRAEMRALAELEGLAVEAEHGDFRGGAPAAGSEQIWVLRRA
ncbi:MAG TPA: class I SAM-dependent methyltransferase [Alphaproteobacteria bacterium]|nr:class I SAM-dependent methyltransferase [Alphaproteobacteria bacterium]